MFKDDNALHTRSSCLTIPSILYSFQCDLCSLRGVASEAMAVCLWCDIGNVIVKGRKDEIVELNATYSCSMNRIC